MQRSCNNQAKKRKKKTHTQNRTHHCAHDEHSSYESARDNHVSRRNVNLTDIILCRPKKDQKRLHLVCVRYLHKTKKHKRVDSEDSCNTCF